MRSDPKRAYVIGLVGGVGAGKSAVAAAFEELGALRMDADDIAHRVLALSATKRKLRDVYGDSIITGTGKIDRAALAERAFRSRKSIKELEGIVHPEVIRRIRKRTASSDGVIVLDAPLILECGLDDVCDILVYVKAPARVRRARLRRTRNWNEKEVRRRERYQIPVAVKARRADVCVENNGSPARTRRRVRSIWERIQKELHAA